MADARFQANRLKFHTASRVGTQTGQALAQALNVDGHIVTTLKIWDTNENRFPNNADKANTDSVDATNDLVEVFKQGATFENFWNGGKVWSNTLYPDVKLYQAVPMTTVAGSDGGGKFQAYEILAGEDGFSSGTIRLMDWVAPTAVADRENGKPVAGFSGIPMYDSKALKLADASKWAQANGTWQFVYMSGMLIFEPGYTPQDKDSTNGKNKISLTAFKYEGKYLSATVDSLATQVSEINKNLTWIVID